MNKNYKFLDAQTDINQLMKLEKLLSDRYNIERKLKINDYMYGSIFDSKKFNEQSEKASNIMKQINLIREKIRLLRLEQNNTITDYDDLTIGQFKNALFFDLYSMINEFRNLDIFTFTKSLHILNKNYRLISIFVIIFILLLLYLILIKFYYWFSSQ